MCVKWACKKKQLTMEQSFILLFLFTSFLSTTFVQCQPTSGDGGTLYLSEVLPTSGKPSKPVNAAPLSTGAKEEHGLKPIPAGIPLVKHTTPKIEPHVDVAVVSKIPNEPENVNVPDAVPDKPVCNHGSEPPTPSEYPNSKHYGHHRGSHWHGQPWHHKGHHRGHNLHHHGPWHRRGYGHLNHHDHHRHHLHGPPPHGVPPHGVPPHGVPPHEGPYPHGPSHGVSPHEGPYPHGPPHGVSPHKESSLHGPSQGDPPHGGLNPHGHPKEEQHGGQEPLNLDPHDG